MSLHLTEKEHSSRKQFGCPFHRFDQQNERNRGRKQGRYELCPRYLPIDEQNEMTRQRGNAEMDEGVARGSCRGRRRRALQGYEVEHGDEGARLSYIFEKLPLKRSV